MKNRLSKIDEARGFTLISMILYHFMWDLRFLAGVKMDWYTGPVGHIWQQSICISFILISGFCFWLGHNHIKRGLQVFFSGVLVSMVTLIAMPENRVVFGILTFAGTAGLLMIPINKIHKKIEKIVDAWTLNMTLFISSFLLFLVTYYINDGVLNLFVKRISVSKYLYDGYVMTFLGFPDPTFYSTDYFPIMPWIFMYMTGYYLYRLLCFRKGKETLLTVSDSLNSKVNEVLSGKVISSIAFIGRNTLIIYLIHQPVLYLVTLIVQKFMS